MTAEEENIYLREMLKREQEERRTIVRNIKRAMQVLGLYPTPPDGNVKKAAVKAITSLTSQLVVNSKALEEKFSFFQELAPIIDKYKDEPL